MASRKLPDLATLGQFVRDCRKTLGLSQEQLADRLGWTQEQISTLERGGYGLPSLPLLVRLSEALGTQLGPLLAAAGFDDVISLDATSGEPATNAALFYTLQRLLTINAPDLSGALNEASDMVAEAMGVEKVDAFMYDPSIESLVALGTSNTPMGRKQHETGLDRIPIANRGRVVEVYESGRYFHSGHLDQDGGVEVGVKEVLGVRSMLAVPLQVNGQIQGVLSAQPVDLVGIVQQIAGEAQGLRENIEIRAPDELVVEADPGRIAQVLGNLVNNAVQHSPDESPIAISVGREKRDDGEWAIVSVNDRGPGIAPDFLPNLFTRFAMGPRSTGLGLGLYLARSIVEAHGGTLTVESTVGQGTTFWLALPMDPHGVDVQ